MNKPRTKEEAKAFLEAKMVEERDDAVDRLQFWLAGYAKEGFDRAEAAKIVDAILEAARIRTELHTSEALHRLAAVLSTRPG